MQRLELQATRAQFFRRSSWPPSTWGSGSGRRWRSRRQNTSVSAFALEFALEKLGRRPKKILLIGTGKTARLAATQLKGTKIYIASRRKDARQFFPNATFVTHKQLKSHTWDGDLVISATRHSGYVIKKGDLPDKQKLVLLDLAFPRNIDPALRASPDP